MRQWFDCGAPQVTSVSAPSASAAAHQELELAGLVAAGKEAEQVVALDPDLGAAAARALRRERGAEARQRLERRRPGGVAAAGEAGEVHGVQQGSKPGDCRPA